ncbi:hypothetical protein [Arthrobacter sp. ERGS1:01]|uniref:hypothetical protein n=1 Tax=Arthrobacter sp. ERGS1:01 TaxID=1704044 RepID=UPI0006B4B727|nr:hypothetical protein [Arthrobacter sp. ERGS1:01]
MAAGLAVSGSLTANAAPFTTASPMAAAQATKPVVTKVAINKIPTIKVDKKTKRAVVKPVVKSSGQVQIASSRITVKQGSRIVAKNVPSASLAAGKYQVTTTAKFKTWTNKTTTRDVKSTTLVSNGSKLVKMNCKVVKVEPHYTEGYDVDLLFLECTGAFDGVYKARAGYFPYTDNNWYVAGQMIWGDSFPEEPNIRPILGSRFTTNVYPLERKVYKTTITKKSTVTRVWSKEQAKVLAQTLSVVK